jgi:hypothetical protein
MILSSKGDNMTKHARATFEVRDWQEKPTSEVEGGPKLTHAHVTKSFHGDIVGEGTIEYLIAYHADGNTDYMGLERIVGRIGDRQGSFVLEHRGRDDGHAASSTYTVVPGSGTGDLRGLKGQGKGVATREQNPIPFELDYELEG